MPYTFVTPNSDQVSLEPSFWSGKVKVLVNGSEVQPTQKKFVGGSATYALPSGDLEIKRSMFFDPAPQVSLNGRRIEIAPPLQWWEYGIAGLPLVVVILGGLIPVLVALAALYINYSVMRSSRSLGARIAICLGVFVAAILVVVGISLFVSTLINP